MHGQGRHGLREMRGERFSWRGLMTQLGRGPLRLCAPRPKTFSLRSSSSPRAPRPLGSLRAAAARGEPAARHAALCVSTPSRPPPFAPFLARNPARAPPLANGAAEEEWRRIRPGGGHVPQRHPRDHQELAVRRPRARERRARDGHGAPLPRRAALRARPLSAPPRWRFRSQPRQKYD
jgi:hypothetical protein